MFAVGAYKMSIPGIFYTSINSPGKGLFGPVTDCLFVYYKYRQLAVK